MKNYHVAEILVEFMPDHLRFKPKDHNCSLALGYAALSEGEPIQNALSSACIAHNLWLLKVKDVVPYPDIERIGNPEARQYLRDAESDGECVIQTFDSMSVPDPRIRN